jgi:hypothetical protein
LLLVELAEGMPQPLVQEEQGDIELLFQEEQQLN